MTVSNNYAPVVTAANGTSTVFTASWNALSASYVAVQLLNTTTGVYTTVTQGVGAGQYQVTTLTPTSLVITFNTAPASGNNVVISRDTTQTQTIPYTTSRGFQGSVEEGSFDALTNMVQELQEAVNNSIQVSMGDATKNLVLPIAALRASSYLGFDASGNVITLAGTIGTVSVSSAMAPVLVASTTAAALALLGGVSVNSPNLITPTRTTIPTPGVASSQLADMNAVVLSQSGGFINKIRNPNFAVAGRGTSGTITTSGGYALDGVFINPTGASCTWAQNLNAGAYASYNMSITGATGVTDIQTGWRIDSESMGELFYNGNTQLTFQVSVYNSTGASITPTMTVQYFNAVNNSGAFTTDVSAVALQPVANNSGVVCAYTWTPGSANYKNGIQILVDFGNNFSSNAKSVSLYNLDLSATPGVSVGLNNSPPVPELRPLAVELAYCQSFYRTSYGNGVAPGTATSAGLVGGVNNWGTSAWSPLSIPFGVSMRSPPTIQYWDAAGNASKYSTMNNNSVVNNVGGLTVQNQSQNGFQIYAGAGNDAFIHYAASSEL